jgi:YhfZ C-terminal domain/Helix-turn-helix domain
MKKIEEARASIAQALLALQRGDTLPRTIDLARSAGVGAGTVQGALEALESDGSIETSAHGSAGRRLITSDTTLLWKNSGRGALSGVLPLPESREFAGLATAISSAAAEAGLPLQLLFRQGSRTRIEQVSAGIVDFSLMSKHAAETSPAALSWIELGEHSYYAPDAVVVITPRGRDPRPRVRVAVDRASSDHAALTLREFPDAELADMPYLFIPEAVAKAQVDAAVWHRTTSSPLMTATGLSIHELSTSDGADDGILEAVLAWRTDDPGVGHLIATAMAIPTLRSIQTEVMDGVRVPQF